MDNNGRKLIEKAFYDHATDMERIVFALKHDECVRLMVEEDQSGAFVKS